MTERKILNEVDVIAKVLFLLYVVQRHQLLIFFSRLLSLNR